MTVNHLAFYSFILGTETKILLRWTDVVEIETLPPALLQGIFFPSWSAGVGNSPGSVPLFMVGDGRFQNYIIALLILRIFGYIFVFRLCSLILNSVVEPVPPERNRSGYDQNFGIIAFKEVQIVHA